MWVSFPESGRGVTEDGPGGRVFRGGMCTKVPAWAMWEPGTGTMRRTGRSWVAADRLRPRH